jgi:hypothetical protein
MSLPDISNKNLVSDTEALSLNNLVHIPKEEVQIY